MSSSVAATDDQLRSVPVRKPGRPRKGTGKPPIGLTKRVEAALLLMVHGGDDGRPLTRPEAAAAVGLSDISLRLAFSNPVVMQFYNAQLDVLRTSARPRAVLRIAELMEQDKSLKVALDAARHIDTEGKAGSGPTINVGVSVMPGYIVSTADYDAGVLTQIEHQALIGRKGLK